MNAERVKSLRDAIVAQRAISTRYPASTAIEWADGYSAALGWVLHRLDGLLEAEELDRRMEWYAEDRDLRFTDEI